MSISQIDIIYTYLLLYSKRSIEQMDLRDDLERQNVCYDMYSAEHRHQLDFRFQTVTVTMSKKRRCGVVGVSDIGQFEKEVFLS